MGTIAGPTNRELYEFGPFRVDVEKETLQRAGEPVPLTPKTFQILLVLVRHSQEIVTKNDLLKTVWPDTFVEEANLSRNMAEALRRGRERGLDAEEYLMLDYDLAFLHNDRAAMERVAVAARARLGAEGWISSKEACALAYGGQMGEARRMIRQAVDQALQAKQAREQERGSRELPSGKPCLATPRKRTSKPRQRYAAATEFAKITQHRGIVVSDPIGALAELQLARSYVIAGQKDRAKSQYQTFLLLWVEANPNLPVLTEARREYGKLL